MDEMEKNELEKNEELEPKEAVETKEEPTQEEASVTDAPAAEEAVETAEASVNKTCADEDDSHHKHFPGKQRPCKAAQRFVQEHQRYTAFQGSCGTYVFAERRHRKPCGHLKYNGEQDYKYNQYHVLQFG